MLRIQDYYRSKWGGLNDEEVYYHPFNNMMLSYFIDPKTKTHI